MFGTWSFFSLNASSSAGVSSYSNSSYGLGSVFGSWNRSGFSFSNGSDSPFSGAAAGTTGGFWPLRLSTCSSNFATSSTPDRPFRACLSGASGCSRRAGTYSPYFSSTSSRPFCSSPSSSVSALCYSGTTAFCIPKCGFPIHRSFPTSFSGGPGLSPSTGRRPVFTAFRGGFMTSMSPLTYFCSNGTMSLSPYFLTGMSSYACSGGSVSILT